jgi:soluble lytic murein transglycosylase-like protein
MGTPLYAGDGMPPPESATSASSESVGTTDDPERAATRAAIQKIIERETANTKLPSDIAEAVVFVESRYDPAVIGRVGEIGLMQVRPETASMLGFRGSNAELAEPDINIHYGVLYLSHAWRLSGGDLCRALMKYRAGHGEETMTPRSQIYCNRVRNRLLAINSPLTSPEATVAVAAIAASPPPPPTAKVNPQAPMRPRDAYAKYGQGTAAASRAYWAAHEARIKPIKARIEARWKRVASR